MRHTLGAWGTGLYSDDTACDVRDNYADILADGILEPDATRRMLDLWAETLSDPDSAPVFWLALADTQWQLGRLQEIVLRKALAVIEDGTDLARWQADPKLARKRAAILESLRQKLISPQPAEKKIKPRYIQSTDWVLGDVYSLRLRSGNFALLHVTGFHQDKGGRTPVCALLDWAGDTVPEPREMRKLKYKSARWSDRRPSQFRLAALSAKDFPVDRVQLVAQGIKPKQEKGDHTVILWRYVDQMLEEFFGLQE